MGTLAQVLQKATNLVFGTSRFRRISTAITLLLVFLMTPLIMEEPAYVFSIAGGALGSCSTLAVLIGIWMTPNAEKNSSQTLLFWRALCDFGLGVRFLTYFQWNNYVCNAPQCYIVDPDANFDNIVNSDYTTYDDRCGLPSAVLEFFEICSEGWFICLAIDLAITISNPFSSFKDRLKRYHVFSWCVGAFMATVLGLTPDLYGFWYVTPELNNNTFCWVQIHRSEPEGDKISINYRPWVMFYIPLMIVYIYAMIALYIAYTRLQNGISKTFQHRVKVLILNSVNITVYLLYWSMVLLLYALVNDIPPSSPAEAPLYKMLLFCVSGKGFADMIVWILIVDTNNVMSELAGGGSADEDSGGAGLDLNQALRMEVLYYATAGIRKCTQRGRKSPKDAERTVISMVQKQSVASSAGTVNRFTPRVFFLIILGFRTEVAQLMASTDDGNKTGPKESAAKRRSSRVQQNYVDSQNLTVAERFKKEQEDGGERPSQRDTVVSGTYGSSNPMLQQAGKAGKNGSLVVDTEKGTGGGVAMSAVNSSNTSDMLSAAAAASSMENTTRESEVYAMDYDTSSSAGFGDDSSVASSVNGNADKSGEGCGPFCRRMLLGSAGQTHTENNKVIFTEFAPHEFRRVREKFGVTDAVYEDAFQTTIKERLTEGGASGAFFFFSKGEKFIAKSCNEEEMNLLVLNAKTYANYLEKNVNSLITKIYGAYQLHIYGTDLYFFVMNNLLLTKDNEPLNEKYDLKGSWVARNSTPPQHGQRVTCSFCNQKFTYQRKSNKSKTKAAASRDFDGADAAAEAASGKDKVMEDRCPVTVHGYHEPNVIMKDNDLKYKIRLPQQTAIDLYMQLRQDAYLLCGMGIMDYSLLVGVHNTEYDIEEALIEEAVDELGEFPIVQGSFSGKGGAEAGSPRGDKAVSMDLSSSKGGRPGTMFRKASIAVRKKNNPLRAAAMSASASAEGPGDDGRPSDMDDSSPGSLSGPGSAHASGALTAAASSAFDESGSSSKRLQVSRVVGPEAYYVGIIDFLQEWNLKKKAERYFKVHLRGADPDGLSAIEPATYRDRFMRRMEELLDVDEDELAAAVSKNKYPGYGDGGEGLRGTTSSTASNKVGIVDV